MGAAGMVYVVTIAGIVFAGLLVPAKHGEPRLLLLVDDAFVQAWRGSR